MQCFMTYKYPWKVIACVQFIMIHSLATGKAIKLLYIRFGLAEINKQFIVFNFLMLIVVECWWIPYPTLGIN